jgi:long-chain acyl-CoA synthetase
MTAPPWGDRESAPASFAELLIEAIPRHRSRPAVQILGATETDRLTWAQLGRLVGEACRWLAQRGVTGRLSLIGEPSPGYHVLEMAALVSGWSINPVYCDAAPADIERVLAAVQPRVIATDGPGQPGWRQAAGAEVVDTTELFATWRRAAASTMPEVDEVGSIVEVLEAVSSPRRPRSCEPAPDKSAALLLQSSGTTGPARVIELPVPAILQAAWAVREVVDPHPRFLAFLPAAHVSHQLINVFAATLLGGEVCFGGGGGVAREAEELVADLKRSRPTVLFGSPLLFAGVVEEAHRALERRAIGRAVWRRLQRHTQRTLERGVIVRGREPLIGRLVGRRLRKALGLRHARAMFSGTAPLDADLHAFLGTLGWFVRNTYGLSESGGAATISARHRMVPGELGAPVDGVDLEVDWDGQLWLRGPSVMRRYLGDPPLGAPDWLATGDLVRPDPHGALCFSTRVSSLVPTAHGVTTLDEIEAAATRLYPGTTSVAVKAGDNSVNLYLFGDHHTLPASARELLGHRPDLACVGRAALVVGAPSPARFEIGPTGKVRRWMIHEHWQGYLEERKERLAAVG